MSPVRHTYFWPAYSWNPNEANIMTYWHALVTVSPQHIPVIVQRFRELESIFLVSITSGSASTSATARAAEARTDGIPLLVVSREMYVGSPRFEAFVIICNHLRGTILVLRDVLLVLSDEAWSRIQDHSSSGQTTTNPQFGVELDKIICQMQFEYKRYKKILGNLYLHGKVKDSTKERNSLSQPNVLYSSFIVHHNVVFLPR